MVSLDYQHNADTSWLACVMQDLDALWNGISFAQDHDLGPPADNFQKWHDFILKFPTTFCKFVNLYVEAMPYVHLPQAVVVCERCECYICGKECASKAVLDGHMSKTHSKISCARLFAFGTRCLACLTEYGSRPRLIRHLGRKGCKCLIAFIANVIPMTPEEYKPLDQEDLIRIKELRSVGRPKHYHPSAVVRVPGPYELFAACLWK